MSLLDEYYRSLQPYLIKVEIPLSGRDKPETHTVTGFSSKEAAEQRKHHWERTYDVKCSVYPDVKEAVFTKMLEQSLKKKAS